jgi:hypothetical protein
MENELKEMIKVKLSACLIQIKRLIFDSQFLLCWGSHITKASLNDDKQKFNVS